MLLEAFKATTESEHQHVYLVAHQGHRTMALLCTKRIGFKVVDHYNAEFVYDNLHNTQPHTRNEVEFKAREFKAKAYYWLRGYVPRRDLIKLFS